MATAPAHFLKRLISFEPRWCLRSSSTALCAISVAMLARPTLAQDVVSWERPVVCVYEPGVMTLENASPRTGLQFAILFDPTKLTVALDAYRLPLAKASGKAAALRGSAFNVADDSTLTGVFFDDAGGNTIPAGVGQIATIYFRAISTFTDTTDVRIDEVLVVDGVPQPVLVSNLGVYVCPVSDARIAATHFALHQNVPNPMTKSTLIRFELAAPGDVQVNVYNAAGRLVRQLATGTRPVGRHVVSWDGTDNLGRHVGAGVYFYRVKTPQFASTRKLVVLK